jgi:phosphatidylserine synthase
MTVLDYEALNRSWNQAKLSMQKLRSLIYVNLANAVSILGVLPLLLLFQEGGYQYLIPLMIYGNVMDDLDGVLAAKLSIKSDFGARLDNVCDAIAHSVIVMFVGMHFGGVCAAASLVGAAAIVIRSVTRLGPSQATSTGSATNELIRHVLFILLLSQSFQFGANGFLVAAFLLHAVSMLVPCKLPYLIRSLTKSPFAIALVNVALLVAWLLPSATPAIAACFIVPYLYSLSVALLQFDRTLPFDTRVLSSTMSRSQDAQDLENKATKK